MQASGAVVGGRVNVHWFDSINHFSQVTPWLHGPARLFAEYGVAVFAGLLLLSWWQARRAGDLHRVAAAVWAPVGALLALGVNQFLVAAIAEPRPYTVLPHALVLVSRSTDPAFPSDHAVMAGAVATGVLLASRKLGLIAAGLAVLMSVTRVYVGAHFPLDVLAGLLVGAAVAFVSYLLARRLVVHVLGVAAGTPLRPLLTSRDAALSVRPR